MNCKRDYLFVLLLVTYLFFGIFHPVNGYDSRSSSEEMESITSLQSEENVEESDTGTGEFTGSQLSQSGSPEDNQVPSGSNSASQEISEDSQPNTSESNSEGINDSSNDVSASASEQHENAENYEDCDVPFEDLEIDYCSLVENEETASYFGLTCGSNSAGASGSGSHETEDLHNPQGTKWPQGIVKYLLDTETLEEGDVDAFYNAVEEYHSKTCIKFVPVDEDEIGSEEARDYIKIWMNPEVCGRASVCKLSSGNFASFGKNCRKTTTMIHELGHNLCLNHEHSRSDRDDYLLTNYDGELCTKKSKKKKKGISNNNGNYRKKSDKYSQPLFYDYSSVMHYSCGKGQCLEPLSSIRSCGHTQQKGLSVLDADSINELYNCHGCHSHRWVTPERVRELMRTNAADFGYRNLDNSVMYPCRASVGAKGKEIAVGMYNVKEKTCLLANGNQVVKEKKKIQVLYIPENMGYGLVSSRNDISDGVAGGHQLGPYKRQYIVYVRDTNGVGSIGKSVWDDETEALMEAEVVLRKKVKRTNEFYVLTCSGQHVYGKESGRTALNGTTTPGGRVPKPTLTKTKTPTQIVTKKPSRSTTKKPKPNPTKKPSCIPRKTTRKPKPTSGSTGKYVQECGGSFCFKFEFTVNEARKKRSKNPFKTKIPVPSKGSSTKGTNGSKTKTSKGLKGSSSSTKGSKHAGYESHEIYPISESGDVSQEASESGSQSGESTEDFPINSWESNEDVEENDSNGNDNESNAESDEGNNADSGSIESDESDDGYSGSNEPYGFEDMTDGRTKKKKKIVYCEEDEDGDDHEISSGSSEETAVESESQDISSSSKESSDVGSDRTSHEIYPYESHQASEEDDTNGSEEDTVNGSEGNSIANDSEEDTENNSTGEYDDQ